VPGDTGTVLVPHSQSGAVPISSLLGVGQLGFWEIGKGGTISWRAPSKWNRGTKGSKEGTARGARGN
jgi:hypothetical protein